MSHEPECPAHWGVGEPTDPCTFCAIARAAYRRGVENKRQQAAEAYAKGHDEGYEEGRQDAAYAVALIGPIGGCSHDVGGTCICDIDRTYAIAVAGGYDTE